MKAVLPLALACIAAAGTEWLEVKSSLVPPPEGAKLVVGQPFKVLVEARHPPGGIALLPASLPLPDTFAERPAARRHSRSGDDRAEIDRYELEILAFDSGELELPPLELAFGSTLAKTAPLSLSIDSGLSKDELPIATSTIPEAIGELDRMSAPNPPPRPVLIPDRRPIWFASGLAAVAIAALVARSILARARRRREALASEPPPPPPRPAHEVAFERLETLRKAGHLERRDLKSFYVELSEVLRWYAGARYEFESVELTVAELIAALRGRRTPGLDLARFEKILDEADLAKYAKYVPGDTEAHSALNGAFEIVDRTADRGEPHAA